MATVSVKIYLVPFFYAVDSSIHSKVFLVQIGLSQQLVMWHAFQKHTDLVTGSA